LETKDYRTHYERDAELFSYFKTDKYDKDYNRRLHSFIKGLITGSSNRILDIGSGGGWSAEKLAGSGNVTLIDLSYKNLNVIKNKFDVAAAVGDAIELPFKKESFDYVILSEALEHINKPPAALREALRVTRKGGKVIVTTPYNEKIRYYLCVHCNQLTPANAHLHTFTISSFEKVVEGLEFFGIKFYKFGSKLLTVTRLSYALRFLPYWIWRIKDRIANYLVDRANTLIAVIKK